jgi:bifunctional DNA-binding transcriptional regulator/antitoxin component of YhaV-PrlF toxin-antitoxin module
MNTFVMTVTQKGQLTVPIDIRNALGITDKKNKLIAIFNPKLKSFTVEQPPTFENIQKLAQSFIKPGTTPIRDARAFYETREIKV